MAVSLTQEAGPRHVVAQVLLAAETRVRMHLRRILSGCTAIEVVGHVRPGTAATDAVQRCGANLLLVDAAENPAIAIDALRTAAGSKLRVVVLVGDEPFSPPPESGGIRTLRRPSALEEEAARSPFGQALQSALLSALGITAVHKSAPATTAPAPRQLVSRPELIAIGSSTGGPQALPEVLGRLLGRVQQPIIVTQHMPAAFTQMLAEHLGRHTALPTVEARDGMPLLRGRVHIAPGGSHLLLVRHGDQVMCHLDDGPPENFCKPAVDPMLRSVVSVFGGRAVAVILTGMGQDGLLGCRTLVEAGGCVLAQDEASSVVWGMPGAVANAGICRAILPLDRIADGIVAIAGTNP